MQQSEWTTGTFTLSILGVPVTMRLSLPAFPVRARVVLPVFQQMSDVFAGMGSKAVETAGRKISCKAGCGACCRQPVPLTEIEIYHIADLVDSLPEPRRGEVRQRFRDGAQRLFDNGWFQRFDFCKDEDELKALVFEYFALGIPCPFLEQESCSIHPDRPVICREYLVTSSSGLCRDPRNEEIERVALPQSATHGLSRVGRSTNMVRKNFLFMIFALHYAGQHPESLQEKTGEEWLSDFFGNNQP